MFVSSLDFDFQAQPKGRGAAPERENGYRRTRSHRTREIPIRVHVVVVYNVIRTYYIHIYLTNTYVYAVEMPAGVVLPTNMGIRCPVSYSRRRVPACPVSLDLYPVLPVVPPSPPTLSRCACATVLRVRMCAGILYTRSKQK